MRSNQPLIPNYPAELTCLRGPNRLILTCSPILTHPRNHKDMRKIHLAVSDQNANCLEFLHWIGDILPITQQVKHEEMKRSCESHERWERWREGREGIGKVEGDATERRVEIRRSWDEIWLGLKRLEIKRLGGGEKRWAIAKISKDAGKIFYWNFLARIQEQHPAWRYFSYGYNHK